MPFSFAFLSLVLLAGPDDAAEVHLRSSPEQRLLFAKQAAGGYRFRLPQALSNKVTLQPDPILRWNNHVVREDDGMLFLWTDGPHGRPVAAAQFFLVDTVWHHEFQSVIDEPIEASDLADDWKWGPTRDGVVWRDPDGELTGGDSATQRLRQMKQLVGRYSAAVDPDVAFKQPEQLRLLTTPVYRYSSPSAGIIDGAVFAFVQGTNPEILVLVEALGQGSSRTTWRFGFARMSCFYLRLSQDRKVIWSEERAPVPTPDRTSPYFFRLSAQADGSADVVVPRTASTPN
jgi:hypothetical protein